ncbi:YciI family protein [Microbacterium hydrocarbonoxydans]|uniref:YciI family protein n=1 Tax=Microbacterium hydrocarbonoxydans TaxID=273678 RepID=UPI0013DC64D2|nr:YciI family protein [Microbacterium hydrocarbonoxydans]
MRFMLMQTYGPTPTDCPPMSEWPASGVRAHIAFQQELNARLAELGELIDAVGLADPEAARIVTSDGRTPVVTDGPFPEAKELLAGYRVVDVESWDRALEIASQVSAAPGPDGTTPIQAPIEVRPVMGAPATDDL